MKFDDLGLIEPLLRAVKREGYDTPTPVQTLAIPHVLAGDDLMACAQTGTGKTAGFALPILQMLHTNEPAHNVEPVEASDDQDSTKPRPGKGRQSRDRSRGRNRKRSRPPKPIRALILSPTRELAAQIGESFDAYSHFLKNIDYTTIFGGVRQKRQTQDLTRGVDVVVATPGRLMDLMQQGYVHLDTVEIFVLDEADRMLDMGFIDDIRRIERALPKQRQTLMFSATIPPAIDRLARSILTDPEQVRIKPEAPAAENVTQQVYFVETPKKQELLEHVLEDEDITRALVFTRTKRRADIITARLQRQDIDAAVIHSDRSQADRQRALKDFSEGRSRVLIASDIAARGLDVDDISHVINFDMPDEPETYVHRIGRTGRAGAKGLALSFCAVQERPVLSQIESLVKKPIEFVEEHPYASRPPAKKRTLNRTAYRGRRKPVRRNLLRGRRR
jgi:ATP-dependent RNA helicase RhlE